MVTALTMNIDPANMAMLNEHLTQLRLRKEYLEQELQTAQQSSANQDVDTLRKWARAQLAGLRAAMNGTRNGRTRNVIATYIDRITVWPSKKRGEMWPKPAADALWKCNCDERGPSDRDPSPCKQHDRPKGGSWANRIGARRFELPTSASRTQRSKPD